MGRASFSILPSSRHFPSPSTPFDTEAMVVGAANVVRADERFDGVCWIASHDSPKAPHMVVVRGGPRDAIALGEHLLSRMGEVTMPTSSTRRHVSFESVAEADDVTPMLEAAGLKRADLSFYGVAAIDLASGTRLTLDALVGDDVWREWAEVQRVILAESLSPVPVNEALLDRLVEYKRSQQRESPPIRRFVGRDAHGCPVAMVGYAPFARCDLGFAREGVLVRLRDVAVLPRARGHGFGTALLRAVAARAIEECEATQVLICGAAEGVPAALYRSVGARNVGACALFSGPGNAGASNPRTSRSLVG